MCSSGWKNGRAPAAASFCTEPPPQAQFTSCQSVPHASRTSPLLRRRAAACLPQAQPGGWGRTLGPEGWKSFVTCLMNLFFSPPLLPLLVWLILRYCNPAAQDPSRVEFVE